MIIFEILKIIGFILLALLGLFVFILLMLLFVPIRYKFNIDNSEEFRLVGNLRFLFGVLSAHVATDDEEKLRIKVFGIPVKAMKLDDETDGNNNSSVNDDLSEEEALFNMSVKLNSIEKTSKQDSSNETDIKESIISRIKNKLLSLINRIKAFFLRAVTVIKNIKLKIERIYSFITDENVIAAFTEHRGRILRILKHLGPQKSDLTVDFGLEDPANVGMILAAISPFYGVYGRWLTISPHFDEKIFKVKGNIRGRAYIIYLLWHFIRVYFNKNVKTIIKNYKTSC